MKIHAIPALILATLIALPQLRAAESDKPAPAPVPAEKKASPLFGGKVSAIAEGSITVANKQKGDQTFKIDTSTKFAKSDGSEATAADVKVGAQVQVKVGATPDLAAKITLVVVKKKDPAKDPSKDPAKKGQTPTPADTTKDPAKAYNLSEPLIQVNSFIF